MREKRLRRWECAALTALCLCLLAGAWAQGRQNEISGALLRLHVVAASDAPEEQALKLRVRDAVLAYLTPRLEGAADLREARERLRRELPGLQAAAEAAAEGRSVRLSLGRERYPLRTYGALRLPAGRYESLRVVLGEGAGHNWWCVIFPPLCVESCAGESLRSAMGRESGGIVDARQGFELRFRTVEIWGELTAALDRD